MTGPNFTITFNEGANAFIGGRGSGKTSILEYLCFALGRSSLDLIVPDKDSATREREMLKTTLRNGGVRITLLRDGIEETWERRLDSMSTITIASNTKQPNVEILNVEQAQTRFYARAFSQKQLSSLIADPKDADEQITGVAAAEVRVERQASLSEIERRRQEIRLAFESVILHWQHTQALDEAKRRAADVDRRYVSMSAELEKAGLSEAARQAIENDSNYRAANRLLSTRRSAIDSFSQRIADLRSLSETQSSNIESAIFPEVSIAAAVVETLADGVRAAVSQIDVLIAEARAALDQQQSSFDAKRTKHSQELAEALEKQKSLDDQLKILTSLTAEKEALSTEIESLTIEFSTRKNAQVDLDQKIILLRNEAVNHRAILEKAAAKVEEMSGGLLRATVQSETVPAEYLSAFSDTCDGIRIQSYDSKCKDMLDEILKVGGLGWHETVKVIFDLFHTKIRTGGKQPTEAEVSSLKNIYGALTPTQYVGIYTRTDSSRVGRLLGAVATDYIAFSYCDRGTFIDFAQASPGQQAGALLTLLLNQEAGTLIIDQPEDDLDNRVIMDIVAQMRQAKTRRQLIFSTHNANVVVNGDADKIVVLRPATNLATSGNPSTKISIEADGAIETKKVKESITGTLEGGEKAFDLRRRKYIS